MDRRGRAGSQEWGKAVRLHAWMSTYLQNKLTSNFCQLYNVKYRYGVGKWRLIQKDESCGPVLANRSNVDLKVHGSQKQCKTNLGVVSAMFFLCLQQLAYTQPGLHKHTMHLSRTNGETSTWKQGTDIMQSQPMTIQIFRYLAARLQPVLAAVYVLVACYSFLLQ